MSYVHSVTCRREKKGPFYIVLADLTFFFPCRPSDDHFVQIMCIRKGKRMVARILPFLSTEQAADILMITARNLPFLIKKDAQDEVIPKFSIFPLGLNS